MTAWRSVRYLRTSEDGPPDRHVYTYELTLPEPLASWDVFDYWERERTDAIATTLRPGDVLFDVGAEHGWLSTVYAQTVGPQSMVLFEPTPQFWPNIRRTWEANRLAPPAACWAGLVGDDNAGDALTVGFWPDCADGPLIDRNAYRYLHDNDATPRVTLDTFVTRTAIIPAALTIDVEGAEQRVLRGAHDVLEHDRPVVFVSIHPDLMLRDYGTPDSALHELMGSHGYRGEHLATDHEQHWVFTP